MRLRYLVAPTVVVAALALASPASAGEVTGTGKPTPATSNAHSICVYSGLQDGDDNDDGIPEGPHGPGVAPQNWGHDKGAFGATPAERKASGFQPGDACNGHSGFLSGGGGGA